jgi:signal transduction histidine kinase
MKIPAHLRTRLGFLFTAGFGLLLLLGGISLYLWLARGYRADFDRTLSSSVEALDRLFHQEKQWFPDSREAAQHVVGELLFPDRVFLAFEGDTLVALSRGPEGITDPAALRPPRGVGEVGRVVANGAAYRVLGMALDDRVDGFVALPEAPLTARLQRLRWALLLGLPMILVVGGVLGALGSGVALRPVVGVAGSACRVAGEVGAGASHFHRLPPARADDEIGAVTEAFNTLVDRLEVALGKERELVEHQRRFLASAAHELRMPVTILRTEAEVALERVRAPEAYRTVLHRIVRESEQLADLVADLLLLARADATSPELAPEALYLDDLVGSVLSRVRNHPDARDRVLRVGRFDPAPATADPALTERAIGVLVHNALVHGRESPVEVHTGVEARNGVVWSWVEVMDEGPGIPPGEEERIFERFVRLDGRTTGSGLGLSIARWIVEVQGGTLTARNRPAGGAVFRMALSGRGEEAPAGPEFA